MTEDQNDAAFREVNHELRAEQRNRILRKVAPYIGASGVIIVVAVFATTLYTNHQNEIATKSASSYLEMISTPTAEQQDGDTQSQEGAQEGIDEAANEPKTINPEFLTKAAQSTEAAAGGYEVLTKFAEAAAFVETDQWEQAVAKYRDIWSSDQSSSIFGALAIIKAALVSLNFSDSLDDDLTQALTELAADGAPMRATAIELLAISAYKSNDLAASRKWYAQIEGSTLGSPNVRSRTRHALRTLTSLLPSPKIDKQ